MVENSSEHRSALLEEYVNNQNAGLKTNSVEQLHIRQELANDTAARLLKASKLERSIILVADCTQIMGKTSGNEATKMRFATDYYFDVSLQVLELAKPTE